MRIVDLLGKKIDRLTVVGRAFSKNGAVYWRCICRCGKVIFRNTCTLLDRRVKGEKSCGCYQVERITKLNLKYLPGMKFGRLTLERRATIEECGQRYYRWWCVCDCGKKVIRDIRHLAPGGTKSCGCLLIKTPREHVGFVRTLCSYRKAAQNRNLDFLLTRDQIHNIMSKRCVYCNRLPQSVATGRGSDRALENSRFVYNGIDRLDSKVGYTPGNCVPCCQRCNIAKRDYTLEFFILHLFEIVKKQISGVDVQQIIQCLRKQAIEATDDK